MENAQEIAQEVDERVRLVTDEFSPPQGTASLEAYVNGLIRKMHLTKGARFQAYRRHKARAASSIWSIIVLSMYVFSFSVAIVIYEQNISAPIEKFLNMLVIILSAFIVAFSVLEQGNQHDLKAELFLKCSQAISKLHDRLYYEKCIGVVTAKRAGELNDSYQEAVNGFSDNHITVDYITFRIHAGWHKKEPIYSAWNIFRYWVDCWLLMIVAFLFPPTAAGIAWAYYLGRTP